MKGIIGKKVGMTSYFDSETGRQMNCTVVQAGPCFVTQVKTEETDGYSAVQLAFDDKKEKNTNAPMKGHFAKANVAPKRKLVEFRNFEVDAGLGDTIKADIFEEGVKVNVVGTGKGKGFQGVVKRHGFGGVGQRTHGQHNRERAPGSIGAASYPARVFKGMKMGGQTGNKRVKCLGLTIAKIMHDDNLILIRGSVPGAKGSYVIIEEA